MKFFIINLPQDTTKRQSISALCERYNLDYEIIEGVNGRALSEQELRQQVASTQVQLQYRKKPLSAGEIGCALSHKKCFLKIINDNLDAAVVLEDDAIFDESLIEFLAHKDKFPKDLELLLLGHHRQTYNDDGFRIQSPHSRRFELRIGAHSIRRLVGRGNGDYGYYVTRSGAARLLENMQQIFLPSDLYTSDERFVNFYALFPTLVDFALDSSSTQEGFKVVRKSKLRKYIKLFKTKIQFLLPSFKRLKPYQIHDIDTKSTNHSQINQAQINQAQCENSVVKIPNKRE